MLYTPIDIGIRRRYGNTQAIVIDRTARGEPTAIRVTSYADRARGNVKATQERRIKHITRMLEWNDYTTKWPATCSPPHKALSRYRHFAKLYGERLHTSNYPSTKLNGHFLDLPGELRNDIYRMILQDEPLEIAPITARTTRKGPMRAYDHGLWICKKRKSILKIMRTNKEINKETSEVYYGENEFRFTGAYGWYYLLAFMNTIGPENSERLRSITVHVPWEGRDHNEDTMYNMTELERLPKHHSPEWFINMMSSRGLLFSTIGNTHPTPAVAVAQCIQKLEEAGVLTTLKLALNYDFDVHHLQNLPLDVAKFKHGLNIKLLHLAPVERRLWGQTRDMDSSQQPLQRRRFSGPKKHRVIEVLEQWENPEKYAQAQGWEFEALAYDENGKYGELRFPERRRKGYSYI